MGRKHGTLKAAARLGINPYGWGNGKGHKRPREIKSGSPLLEQTGNQNTKNSTFT